MVTSINLVFHHMTSSGFQTYLVNLVSKKILLDGSHGITGGVFRSSVGFRFTEN